MTTVWHAFYDLLRQYGLTTIFGNPGSTEQPMLKNFPADFQYILALQEASVVGMADGYAQATRKPAVVSLHTSAGTGNAMGNIMTAYLNKTPLILIAGQQMRKMLVGEPLLTNRDETTLPKPYVKWAYQPTRAEDVPAALIRAIAVATTAPAGPVYLSIPMDDWDVELEQVPVPRSIASQASPDPEALAAFAGTIRGAKNFALVLGQEVDRSLGWEAAVKLAELIKAPVFQAPLSERAVFPERHPLYRGMLPLAKGPLGQALDGFDVVLVVGAEVWRYYPYIPGDVIPEGTKLLHVTNDPDFAARALVGDTIVADARLALQAMYTLLASSPPNFKAEDRPAHPAYKFTEGPVMSAMDAWVSLAAVRPREAILVQESPSNGLQLLAAWPAEVPESYFTFASGGLGWAAPAAVGIALAERHKGTNRPVVLAIGDGSLHYSVQSIYSAVQNKLKVIYLVPNNEEYAILKAFALLEDTPNVPALDLPGLDAVAVGKAYGCPSYKASNPAELQDQFKKALATDGPTLIEFVVSKTNKSLL